MGGVVEKSFMGSECDFKEKTFHAVFFFFSIPYKTWEGCRIRKHREITWWDLTLGQQGYMWKGGRATMFQTAEYSCPPSLLEMRARVWSVALVADWRELILVIQADGALGKFMLRDDLPFLGSTILRVTWGDMRVGKEGLEALHNSSVSSGELMHHASCFGKDFKCQLTFEYRYYVGYSRPRNSTSLLFSQFICYFSASAFN